MFNQLSQLDPTLQNVVWSFIASLIIVTVVSIKNRHTKTRAALLMDKAAQEGRVAQATRTKVKVYLDAQRFNENGRPERNMCKYKVWYTYESGGRTFTFTRKYRGLTYPPDVVTVYWELGREKKPLVSKFDKLGAKYTLLMLLPWIVFFLVFGVLQIRTMLPTIIAEMGGI